MTKPGTEPGQILLQVREGDLMVVLDQPEVGGNALVSAELLSRADPSKLVVDELGFALIARGGPYIYEFEPDPFDTLRKTVRVRRVT